MCDSRDYDKAELSEPLKQALDMLVKDHSLVSYIAQEVGESVKIISAYASSTAAEVEKIDQRILDIRNEIERLRRDSIGEVLVIAKKKKKKKGRDG